MNIYVRSYVAVGFLLLLSQNSSSTPQERAARTAWAPLTEEEHKDFKYLALIKCKTYMCSASILSRSVVLTTGYFPITCPVYAGKVNVSESNTTITTNTTNTSDMQIQRVVRVLSSVDDLMICTLEKKWVFNEHVGRVTLNDKSGPPNKLCQVLGFRADAEGNIVPHKMEQTIDDGTACGVASPPPDLFYSKAAGDTELAEPDRGGPAVCDKVQWGMNVECKKEGPGDCNSYLSIAHHRAWIFGKDGRGHSLHHSKYEVLLLCLMTIKFLVY